MGAPSPWAWRLPAAALAAIALHQIALAGLRDLSPWKGGGFGMFASADRARARRVLLWREDAGERRPTGVRSELENARQRARALPDDDELDALLRQLAAVLAREGEPAEAVGVDVWRIRFDPPNLALRGEHLNGAELRGTDGGARGE